MPMSRGPSARRPDQKAMINRSMDVIENFTGKRPVGWLGPGLTQTLETPEFLAEAGVKYIGDWVYDDEPTVIRTEKGPLTTLPYTVEMNDIPMMMVQHHESTQLLNRAKDQFDRLYAESAERPKIMSIAIHPYISGQPFRIKYLEAIYDYVNQFEGVVHWNGAQILDWYNTQVTEVRRDVPADAARNSPHRRAGRGWRRFPRTPRLLRGAQLSRPHPRDEGGRRARSAVLLPEAARQRGAGRRARALSAVHRRLPVRG